MAPARRFIAKASTRSTWTPRRAATPSWPQRAGTRGLPRPVRRPPPQLVPRHRSVRLYGRRAPRFRSRPRPAAREGLVPGGARGRRAPGGIRGHAPREGSMATQRSRGPTAAQGAVWSTSRSPSSSRLIVRSRSAHPKPRASRPTVTRQQLARVAVTSKHSPASRSTDSRPATARASASSARPTKRSRWRSPLRWSEARGTEGGHRRSDGLPHGYGRAPPVDHLAILGGGTSSQRYTSWTAFSISTPSPRARWKALRPVMGPSRPRAY